MNAQFHSILILLVIFGKKHLDISAVALIAHKGATKCACNEQTIMKTSSQ